MFLCLHKFYEETIMQLFYSSNIPESEMVLLDHEESRHCAKVLRKKPGDEIEVVDGKGNLYHARLLDVSSKTCKAEILEVISDYGKRNFSLTVAIAPTKNNSRFEWFLEKATEIGIDKIVPLVTKRSERKRIKKERLNKILVSAMKQAGKAFLPELCEPVNLKEYLTSLAEIKMSKYIATCNMEDLAHLKDVYKKNNDVIILVGPEGDFTEEEVKSATEISFQPISLGPSRLKVETAGIVACHTINLINE